MGAWRDHRQAAARECSLSMTTFRAGRKWQKKSDPSLTEDPLPESVHFGKNVHLF